MPRIRQLSASLVNKIAAGEVIERPASVVKELMENAVDAGARRIDVSIQAGGSDLIRVVDDGCGIEAEELPLAIASHATSKIATVDDLFSVGTLGFRGEALASIAEVSRLTLRSRPPESDSGAELEVVGGELSEVVPCGCPVGTTIEIRNLFFNTPVRKKFLRTTQTEMGHLTEAFHRIALPCPEIHFTLRHNDRPVSELPAEQDWRERIARCFGRDIASSLIRVESSDGPVRLAGYVAQPTQSRSNNRMQYLFLNGRHIRDRALQHALTEAYRGLLTVGRYPIAFLAFQMPPELADVNVHPTKLEVRFQESGSLYKQLLSTLRSKFLTTDLTARVDTPADEDPTGAHDEARAAEMRQELVDWAKGQVAGWETRPADNGPSRQTSLSLESEETPPAPLELTRLGRVWAPAGPQPEAGETPSDPPAQAPETSEDAPSPLPPAAHGHRPRALQVQNRYLVAESPDGVMVIDQHALHERILYEHLRQRVLSGGIEVQTLLVPEPVDLGPAEMAAALENRELLARLGLKIEPFGGNTLLVGSYPAMLVDMNPAEVLHALIENLLAGTRAPDSRDFLDELLHTIACKAAVKAGDSLAPQEVEALLQQRHLIDDAHHCPHGRPTALVFTNEELDRQFKRT